jgi:hypothetical protein
VHDAAHFLRREVDGGLARVGDDEAVAVAVAFDPSFDLAEQAAGRRCRA